MHISCLIVNWNTKDLLLQCLASLNKYALANGNEIIVVDNASSDGSAYAVTKRFPHVKLIRNSENRGFSAANNQAIQISSGDILILLNPDTLTKTDLFDQCSFVFKRNPQVGVIGPLLLNKDYSIQPSFGCFASAWTEFLFQTFLFKFLPTCFPFGKRVHSLQVPAYSSEHPVDWVSGACLAIRRSVVQEIGMLDESIFMYGEDMEWCWRVKQAGYQVWFCPQIEVIHLLRQASKKNYTTWIQRYTQGQLTFLHKTQPKLGSHSAGLFVIAGSILRMMIWSIVWLIASRRRLECSQRILGYTAAAKMGIHQLLKGHM